MLSTTVGEIKLSIPPQLGPGVRKALNSIVVEVSVVCSNMNIDFVVLVVF